MNIKGPENRKLSIQLNTDPLHCFYKLRSLALCKWISITKTWVIKQSCYRLLHEAKHSVRKFTCHRRLDLRPNHKISLSTCQATPSTAMGMHQSLCSQSSQLPSAHGSIHQKLQNLWRNVREVSWKLGPNSWKYHNAIYYWTKRVLTISSLITTSPWKN